MKYQKRVKRKKFYVTSLVLPNYRNYKKDVIQLTLYITLAALSICKENQEGNVKPIGGRSLPLLFKSINIYKLYTFEKR